MHTCTIAQAKKKKTIIGWEDRGQRTEGISIYKYMNINSNTLNSQIRKINDNKQ